MFGELLTGVLEVTFLTIKLGLLLAVPMMFAIAVKFIINIFKK